MKSVLLMCWMALLSVAVSAQDFASRFMAEHQADSNLTCVTISPKMMEEIMKRDAEKERKHRRSGKPRSRNQIGRCTERQGYIGEQNRFNGRIQ